MTSNSELLDILLDSTGATSNFVIEADSEGSSVFSTLAPGSEINSMSKSQRSLHTDLDVGLGQLELEPTHSFSLFSPLQEEETEGFFNESCTDDELQQSIMQNQNPRTYEFVSPSPKAGTFVGFSPTVIDSAESEVAQQVNNSSYEALTHPIIENQLQCSFYPRCEKYNMVVIGASMAAVSFARRCALNGMTVLLIEKNRLGGSGVADGFFMIQALSNYCAKVRDLKKNIPGFEGVMDHMLSPDFSLLKEYLFNARSDISKAVSYESLWLSGVDVVFANVSFVDKQRVLLQLTDQSNKLFHVRFHRCLISSGCTNIYPQISGLEDGKIKYLTRRTFFELDILPTSLVIVGSTRYSVALAQCLAILGVRVILLCFETEFLPFIDSQAAGFIYRSLQQSFVEVLLGVSVLSVTNAGAGDLNVQLRGEDPIKCEEIYLATYSEPNIGTLDLHNAGVQFDASGVHVDNALRTHNKRIFAFGGCVGWPDSYPISEAASSFIVSKLLHENISPIAKFKALDFPLITFTIPNVVECGVRLTEIVTRSLPYETIMIAHEELPCHVTFDIREGMSKIFYNGSSGRIKGGVFVGHSALELGDVVCTAVSSNTSMMNFVQAKCAFSSRLFPLRMLVLLYLWSMTNWRLRIAVSRFKRSTHPSDRFNEAEEELAAFFSEKKNGMTIIPMMEFTTYEEIAKWLRTQEGRVTGVNVV
ncbi:hypothetical protein PCE1_001313 [Barthelona sp. PCE]